MILDTIHTGDCVEWLESLPDGCADSCVTDPPWMDYKTSRYDASKWHAPVTFLAPELYMGEIYRVCTPTSGMIFWSRWDVFQRHADAATSAGWTVKNMIVWAKPNHTAGDLEGNLGNQHECAAFATKGQWRRFGKRDTNLWKERHLFSRAKRHHPTEKPVGLMARCVEWVSSNNHTVLDPFMGSGTTAVACIQMGRHFLGCEIKPKYVDIANKRIKQARQDTALFAECE